MIRFLELEISTRCNARCSVCPRFEFGSLNKNFSLHDISLESLENSISPEIWEQIETVMLKGTVGDAGFHPNLDGILNFLKNKNTHLHTNGSNRSIEWWKNIVRENLITRFCIDGINAETHFKYRQTNFNKVIEHASAYISAGGRAEWFFIIFKHNQDQIELAKKMAFDLGFESFVAIYSDRYDIDQITQSPDNFNLNLNHIIESRKPSFEWSSENIKPKNFYEKQQNKILVCPNMQSKTVYIAADGMVWPCCYYGSSNLTKDDLLYKLYKNKVLNGDVKRMNINYRSLNDILKDSAWQWWNNYVTMNNPKKCQLYCG